MFLQYFRELPQYLVQAGNLGKERPAQSPGLEFGCGQSSGMVSTLQRPSLEVAPLRLSAGPWPKQNQRKTSALGSSSSPWWDKIRLRGLGGMRKATQRISHSGRGAGEDSYFPVTQIDPSLSISKAQCKNPKDSQAGSKGSPVVGAEQTRTNKWDPRPGSSSYKWLSSSNKGREMSVKICKDSSWILYNLSVTLLIPKP